MAVIYYKERVQSKISKGKIWMGPSPRGMGNNFQASSSSGFTQYMCLNPLAINSDNACEMLSTREAHYSLSAQGFYWGLITQAPFLCLACTKIPDSWKESRC